MEFGAGGGREGFGSRPSFPDRASLRARRKKLRFSLACEVPKLELPGVSESAQGAGEGGREGSPEDSDVIPAAREMGSRRTRQGDGEPRLEVSIRLSPQRRPRPSGNRLPTRRSHALRSRPRKDRGTRCSPAGWPRGSLEAGLA